MKKKTLSNLLLYRWRYALGYLTLIGIFLAVISIALLHAPGGVSQPEIDMIHQTNLLRTGIGQGNFAMPNLPFHLFQLVLFMLFGVSIITIKAPSIILSIIAALSLFFLLRRWFKPGIAVLSLSIMIATGQFIYLAQSFTPGIIYITTASLILLFASLVIQKAKFAPLWRILLAATVAASLYTPFFWYLNIGLALVALLHPYTRYILVSRKYRAKWLPASIVFLLLIAPLVYLCLKDHNLFLALTGWSALQFDIIHNLKVIAHTYFWPTPYISHGQVLPAIDISSLALMFLGLIMTFRHRHTARSYVITIWILLSLPLLAVAPQVNMIITVPMFILLATGVEKLLHEWYKIFPKNPYARGTGLCLVIILIGVMTLSGVNRYIHSYRDLPDSVREHSSDITLLHKTILSSGQPNITLVVTAAERPLYRAVLDHTSQPSLTITDGVPVEATDQQNEVVITHAARQNIILEPPLITRIITSDRAQAGDRFYVYKINQ